MGRGSVGTHPGILTDVTGTPSSNVWHHSDTTANAIRCYTQQAGEEKTAYRCRNGNPVQTPLTNACEGMWRGSLRNKYAEEYQLLKAE